MKKETAEQIGMAMGLVILASVTAIFVAIPVNVGPRGVLNR